ncbi:hypothetical protein DL96DRAFT_1625471 [Flagelloscypha sp. PMI_526]|nr:hypothetical protein DL96DRAFT_1625471 [Flagelloscypha sp. PMI_526]
MENSAACLPANPDVSGIGVRTAIYAQNLLSFVPAFYALVDGKVTFDELDAVETQAMTILITALALLLSAIIEAVTQELSPIHAAIIMNLSCMNNTNLFIYLLLFIHHRAGPHLEDFRIYWVHWWLKILYVQRKRSVGIKVLNREPEEASPRRLLIFLGTAHLSLMAAIGFWLWAHPTTFGTSGISSCWKRPSLVVVGHAVPMTSNGLRVASFVMYSLVALPLFNIIVPFALFFLFYASFNKRYEHTLPPSSKLYHIVALATFQNPWKRASGDTPTHQSPRKRDSDDIPIPQHRIFPISVGLCVLAVINVLFLIDTELTVQFNKPLQEEGEERWSFGQTLALFLLLIPLRDIVEGLQRRREKKMQKRIQVGH